MKRLQYGEVADILRAYYSQIIEKIKPPKESVTYDCRIIGHGGNLGDIIITSSIPHKAKQQNRTLRLFCYHEKCAQIDLAEYLDNCNTIPEKETCFEYLSEFDFGNGHIIQMRERMFNLLVDYKPKGYLKVLPALKKKRVGICLSTSRTDRNVGMSEYIPHAEIVSVVVKFIESHHNEFEFIELGKESFNLPYTANHTKDSIPYLIEEIKQCEYLICLDSGPMHVAAALDIKTVVLYQYSNYFSIYLPSVRNGWYRRCWLYPQNVNLVFCKNNPLAPEANPYNIIAALNGEIYPYWSDEFLDLINLEI